MTPVGLLELDIGGGELVSFQDCERPLSQQLRPADPTPAGQGVQLGDQLIIKLHEHFTPCHGPYGRPYGSIPVYTISPLSSSGVAAQNWLEMIHPW